MSNDNNTLVDSKVALSFFLDSLLKETELPEAVPVIEEPVVSLVVKEEIKEEAIVEEIAEVVAEDIIAEDIIEVQESITVQPKTTIIEEVELAPEPEVVLEPQPEPIEQKIEIPDEPFQVLMFKVAGLSLAVRLVELNGVLEWDENALTEMPGHSPFFLGVIQYLGKSIPIVDTARLVFPADKLISLSADKPYERVKRIVLIDDGKWGLACDEIAEVVDLNAESVKWRENRSKRKWMAGTVIEHMCALVDAAGFSEMLDDGSHNR